MHLVLDPLLAELEKSSRDLQFANVAQGESPDAYQTPRSR
jgi:hypothetical protein